MPYTVQQVQALENALASGAKSVQYGDKKVDYQSAADMRVQLDKMKAELGIGSPARRVFVGHSKGL